MLYFEGLHQKEVQEKIVDAEKWISLTLRFCEKKYSRYVKIRLKIQQFFPKSESTVLMFGNSTIWLIFKSIIWHIGSRT